MRTFAILRRLIWKEFRQGWPMLILGLVLPWLAVSLEKLPAFRDFPIMQTVLFLLLAAIAVWSSTLAKQSGSPRAYVNTHFSLNPRWHVLTTFLFQGGMVQLIAVTYSVVYATIGAVDMLAKHHQEPFLYRVLIVTSIAMLHIAITFGISFVATLAFSPLVGIVSGLLWVVCNTTVMEFLSSPILFSPDISDIDTALLLIASLTTLAAFGILLFKQRGAQHMALPRWVATAVLLGALVVYPLANFFLGLYRITTEDIAIPPSLTSSDGSLAIDVPVGQKHVKGMQRLRFVDYRLQHEATRQFRGHLRPICFIERKAALLACQQPGKRDVTLYRWELATNTLSVFTKIPAKRDALQNLLNPFKLESENNVSPDGRYAVFALRSAYGMESIAQDLWCVDLHARAAKILYPACYSFALGNYSWRGDDLIIAIGESPRCISTATGKITAFPLPAPKEERP